MTATVLDVCWPMEQVLDARGWLRDQVRGAAVTVVVARATVPGVRQLEATLSRLDGRDAVAAVVGLPRRNWPRAVQHSVGPLTRALAGSARVTNIPIDRGLAVAGVDSTPLPPALLAAAGVLFDLITNLTRAEAVS